MTYGIIKVNSITTGTQTIDIDALKTLVDASTPQTRTVTASTGVTGGGALSSDITISADIADQAESEAGTSSTKLMTPQRTSQAITSLARPVGTNAYGLRTVSTSDPTDGSDGDIWLKV